MSYEVVYYAESIEGLSRKEIEEFLIHEGQTGAFPLLQEQDVLIFERPVQVLLLVSEEQYEQSG